VLLLLTLPLASSRVTVASSTFSTVRLLSMLLLSTLIRLWMPSATYSNTHTCSIQETYYKCIVRSHLR
jgi:hypothetical protein